MGRRRLCEAKVLVTAEACRLSPMGDSRWCVSHQDPASRWQGPVAASTAGVPDLAAVVSMRPDVLGGSFGGDLREETITVAGRSVQIVHDQVSGWRCSAEPPAGATPEDYQQAIEAALVGAAVAHTLNVGMVVPDNLEVLAAHIDALAKGEPCAETAWGAQPIAFEAAAFYTLNQVADDMHQRWEGYIPAPSRSRLLPDGFETDDPLRDRETVSYAETCTDKALRAVGAGNQVFMEYLPLERIVGDLVTNSPVAAAEKTGLGSVVGGDLGVFADLYEAHMTAGTGAVPMGLVVLSKAHRAAPESDEFRAWVREHIKIGEDEPRDTALADSKPHSIGGVLDTAVQKAPDADLAVRALKVLAEEAPEEFRSGVQEFCAWELETDKEMLAPFKDDPGMRQLIAGLMAEPRETDSSAASPRPSTRIGRTRSHLPPGSSKAHPAASTRRPESAG